MPSPPPSAEESARLRESFRDRKQFLIESHRAISDAVFAQHGAADGSQEQQKLINFLRWRILRRPLSKTEGWSYEERILHALCAGIVQGALSVEDHDAAESLLMVLELSVTEETSHAVEYYTMTGELLALPMLKKQGDSFPGQEGEFKLLRFYAYDTQRANLLLPVDDVPQAESPRDHMEFPVEIRVELSGVNQSTLAEDTKWLKAREQYIDAGHRHLWLYTPFHIPPRTFDD